MLGETFELVTPDYQFLVEKIQHLPNPTSSDYVRGKHFQKYQTHRPNVKFTGTSLLIKQMHRTHFVLEVKQPDGSQRVTEKYEL